MTINNTLDMPNTPIMRSNTPKELFCPHCEKVVFVRRFVDSEKTFLWALSRLMEHRATMRLREEDYEIFRNDRLYVKRMSWLGTILAQIKHKEKKDER